MMAPSSETTKKRILVAEDDAINRHATLGHLSQLGLVADTALSGEEVLRLWTDGHYDLIFMDCQMPNMDGYTATREIRRRENGGPGIVIIALTALNSPLDRQNCLAAGMNDFLCKPIDTVRLARCLEQWLGEKGGEAGRMWRKPLAATPDFTDQLIPIFLQDAPNHIRAMQNAFEECDAAALERAAHTLKSSSGLLGALSLSQQCETLENRGESGSWQDVAALLQQLELEFDRVRRLLESRIASKKATERK